MFGDTIIYDAKKQVALNLTQLSGIRYYASSVYLQVFKRSKEKLQRKSGESIFFRYSRAANSVVSDGILQKFKLIHTFMYVLVTYNNEENSMKNEGDRVVTTLYSHILDAQVQLTL